MIVDIGLIGEIVVIDMSDRSDSDCGYRIDRSDRSDRIAAAHISH